LSRFKKKQKQKQKKREINFMEIQISGRNLVTSNLDSSWVSRIPRTFLSGLDFKRNNVRRGNDVPPECKILFLIQINRIGKESNPFIVSQQKKNYSTTKVGMCYVFDKK